MLHLALLAALAASPTTGDLVVTAETPFALFIDGRQVNVANLRTSWTALNLQAGRHEVRVDGCPSPFSCQRMAQGFLDVPAGTEVRVKAESGQLVVYETVAVYGQPTVVVQPQPTVIVQPQPTVVVQQQPMSAAVVTADGMAVAAPGISLTVQVPNGQMVVEERREERHRHHSEEVAVAAPAVYVAPPTPQPVYAAPQGMPEPDFAGMVQAIESEGFEDGKLNVLQTAAGSAWFTVEQVGRLVDLFPSSNGKVKVVETCKPHLVDGQNGFQLYSHFNFESDKKKVRGILGR